MQGDKSTKVNFSEQLELLCEKYGLKQKDIADICGVSTAAVSKWFGGRDMKIEHAAVLARKFGLTIEQLAGLEPVLKKASELRIAESAAASSIYEIERDKNTIFEYEINRRQTRDALAIIRSQIDALIDDLSDSKKHKPGHVYKPERSLEQEKRDRDSGRS